MKNNRPVIILGAGSAGLTTATELVKAGRKVIVIEKENRVGGLAHTVHEGNYRFDFGPHAFHSKADEADDVFKEFSRGKYKQIYMKACLFLHGKYFDYPLKFGQAFLRLNLFFTTRMLFDYFKAKIKNLISKVPEDTFEDWGLKRYGKTMYDMAFGNYSSKVWGMSTGVLHRKLAEQKLPDLNFIELARETLGGKGAKQKILYSAYYYPEGGMGLVFEEMAKFCSQQGADILMDSKVTKIHLQDNRVQSVEITSPHKIFEAECSDLIFTIPIPEIMNYIYPQPKIEDLNAANSLVYRNLILVFVEIDSSNVTNQIMVYLLDKDFVFNRIGEQRNIDPTMIPEGKTLLSMEICSDEDDRLWDASDEYLFKLAREDLARLNKIQSKAIKDFSIKRLRQAYPIYDLNFDKNLKKRPLITLMG